MGINPYYWVDDHPLLYGNNGSLDPGTDALGNLWVTPLYSLPFAPTVVLALEAFRTSDLHLVSVWKTYKRKKQFGLKVDITNYPYYSVWYMDGKYLINIQC